MVGCDCCREACDPRSRRSGTTILAAEVTGRRARAIELEPAYVDVAIRRFQKMTGQTARHAVTRQTFTETGAKRARSEDEHVA